MLKVDKKKMAVTFTSDGFSAASLIWLCLFLAVYIAWIVIMGSALEHGLCDWASWVKGYRINYVLDTYWSCFVAVLLCLYDLELLIMLLFVSGYFLR